MQLHRALFEALFEATRQELLTLTDKRLDILHRDGQRPAHSALGNNLGALEVLPLIKSRQELLEKADRLKYHEQFKAVHYINLHPEVSALAAQNKRTFFDFGRRLYVKKKELFDDSGAYEVEIDDDLEVTALCLFNGCADVDEFRKKFEVPEAPPILPKTSTGAKISETLHASKGKALPKGKHEAALSFEYEEDCLYFLFCYFSKRQERVNKALVCIKYNEKEAQWVARQYGFHQPSEGRFESIMFQGEAKVLGERLYINLESRQTPRYPPMQMHFIALLEPLGNVETQKTFPCSFHTVSIHGSYTISTEGYLMRCSKEEIKQILARPEVLMESGIPIQPSTAGLSASEIENLQLYLMMSRKHFHLELGDDGTPLTNLDNLTIRKVPVGKFTDLLKGTWRLWSFGLQRSALIESKLVIGEDDELFRTRFHPYIEPKIKKGLGKGMIAQLATLSISDEIRKEQLCVTTFSPKGDLMNMTCFDFDSLQEDAIADGIFLSVGYDRPNAGNKFKTNGPIGGYVVMRKLQPNEDDFEPQKIPPEKVEAYVKALGLEEMLQRLRLLWKRKTQKKLINLRMGAFAVCADPKQGLLLIQNDEAPYKGRYHLPGGMLKEQGKELDSVLQEALQRQAGFAPSQLQLWQNATDIITIQHGSNVVEEKIHLVGALYKCAPPKTISGEKAFYFNPQGKMLDRNKFTHFAWLAVQDFLKNEEHNNA